MMCRAIVTLIVCTFNIKSNLSNEMALFPL